MATNNTTVNNEAKATCIDNLATPTRKGVYEKLRENICAVNEKVKGAPNNEMAIAAIDEMEELLKHTIGCRYTEDIAATVKDIVGTIPSVRTFDRTRTELHEMVLILIGKIDKILAEEAAKQDIENLRNIFRLCAEHADEIAKIIGVGVIA